MTIAADYLANIVAARDPIDSLAVFVHTLHAKIDSLPDLTVEQQSEIDSIFLDIEDDLPSILDAMQIHVP